MSGPMPLVVDCLEDEQSLAIELSVLRAMRQSGIRQDGETAYRSDAELAAAILDIERRLLAKTGLSTVRTVYFNPQRS